MADRISSSGKTCDRCGHAARVEYRLADDVWRFCDHHAREHDKILRDLGYLRFVDDLVTS